VWSFDTIKSGIQSGGKWGMGDGKNPATPVTATPVLQFLATDFITECLHFSHKSGKKEGINSVLHTA